MSAPKSLDAFLARCGEDCVNGSSGDFSAYAEGIRQDAAEVAQGRGEGPRYTCVDCGRSMRVRGVDGRCFHCIEPTPLRCGVCHRVRIDGDWEFRPVKLPREVAIPACPSCAERKHKAAAAAYWREVRRTERRAATPGGLDHTQTADPFEGFREFEAAQMEPPPDDGGG